MVGLSSCPAAARKGLRSMRSTMVPY